MPFGVAFAAAPTGPWPDASMGSTFCTGVAMLNYAVVFLVIALIAAVMGFGGIASSAAGIAQLLFVIFIILAVVSFAVGLMRRR